MSIFNNIFGKTTTEEKPQFWKELNSEEDLQQAINESFQGKVIIFKHSTRCFISKTVLRNFEKEVEKSNPKNIQFYFLDLLSHRDLSNKIAEDFKIHHQSPQIIVLENGKAVKNASHQSISLSLI